MNKGWPGGQEAMGSALVLDLKSSLLWESEPFFQELGLFQKFCKIRKICDVGFHDCCSWSDCKLLIRW